MWLDSALAVHARTDLQMTHVQTVGMTVKQGQPTQAGFSCKCLHTKQGWSLEGRSVMWHPDKGQGKEGKVTSSRLCLGFTLARRMYEG